jgi:hypothetical protein
MIFILALLLSIQCFLPAAIAQGGDVFSSNSGEVQGGDRQGRPGGRKSGKTGSQSVVNDNVYQGGVRQDNINTGTNYQPVPEYYSPGYNPAYPQYAPANPVKNNPPLKVNVNRNASPPKKTFPAKPVGFKFGSISLPQMWFEQQMNTTVGRPIVYERSNTSRLATVSVQILNSHSNGDLVDGDTPLTNDRYYTHVWGIVKRNWYGPGKDAFIVTQLRDPNGGVHQLKHQTEIHLQ